MLITNAELALAELERYNAGLIAGLIAGRVFQPEVNNLVRYSCYPSIKNIGLRILESTE